ncbi:MAG: hypothetical protein EOO73_02980 [Myxococcales bacterium]|nr:MAG: hypothetical protein EOO73_02980 [Myxococcales bacterium]
MLLALGACVSGSPPDEPTDDPATPGDDRAGYFVCRSYGWPESVLCSPGTICCVIDAPVCVSADVGCPSPYEVVRCDGPEDCEYSGEDCITGTHGTYCSGAEGSSTWCHMDEDCVDVQPWLPDGTCSASGTCTFVVPTRAAD